jgi:hypothetical protein
VWHVYGRWADASSEEAGLAHAAYSAALDREEAAARAYADLIDDVGRFLDIEMRSQLASRGSTCARSSR